MLFHIVVVNFLGGYITAEFSAKNRRQAMILAIKKMNDRSSHKHAILEKKGAHGAWCEVGVVPKPGTTTADYLRLAMPNKKQLSKMRKAQSKVRTEDRGGPAWKRRGKYKSHFTWPLKTRQPASWCRKHGNPFSQWRE